jgi:hypothetical protein
MKRKIVILLVILLAVCLTSAYAGSGRRTGTAGAQELRISVGARGTAMGGAVIANTYGVEAIEWNPAGLAGLEGSEAMFSHQPYLADININFAGIATRFEDLGTFALAAKVVSIGDMEETTPAFPDGTGRIFGPTMSVISLSYSRVLTYRVNFGITGKFIHEKIFEVSANGFAFDLGFMYEPDWHGFSMGIAVKNYGPEMRFTGRGFDRDLDGRQGAAESASFDLPSSFNLGFDYDLVNVDRNLAIVTGNFRSNNYSQDLWQGGLEYVYDGRYCLRAGYNYSAQESWLYGFSFGGGVDLKIGDANLILDYAWAETELFDANQYFTLKFKF